MLVLTERYLQVPSLANKIDWRTEKGVNFSLTTTKSNVHVVVKMEA